MSDDAEIPLGHTGERRAPGRREEDAAILGMVRDSYRWFKRGPRLLALLGGIAVGAASVGSWLGAQQSSPGQRITKLETTVQERFTQVDTRVDTLASVVDSLRTEVAGARAEQDLLRADLRLLLRLGCRPITDADLRQDCVERGARRR